MVRLIQQRFTRGEIDPKMIARSDTDQYFGAVATATNVFGIPQGGFKIRPGLEYIDRYHRQVTRESSPTISAPNGGTTSNANDDNTSTELVTTNNISTTNPYVVVHYDLGSAKNIAFVDIVGGKLTSATSTEFFIQVSTDNSIWTNAGAYVPMSTSDITARRRVRGSYRYVRFVRIGATDLGTDKATIDEMHVFTETANQSNSKLVDFAFNTEQTYMLLVTDKNIAVYKDGVHQIDIRAVKITHAIIESLNWTQSADTAFFVSEDLYPQQLTRGSTDVLWTLTDVSFDFIPKYDFVPTSSNPAATLTPSAVDGTVTLTAGSAVFSSADENQYIDGNGGLARIVKYLTTTTVKAIMEIPFYDTSAIASGAWTLKAGYESVWSLTRGYPKSACFQDSRLWFGGSKSRPQTLWGSRAGLFFDFNPGTLLDDDAIDITLDTNQVNAIVNLVSQKVLQIFTTGGEFAILRDTTRGITPSSIADLLKKQTQSGSIANVRPALVENTTLFAKKNGKAIAQYTFDDVAGGYNSSEISTFSGHLINNPVSMAIRRGSSVDEGSYLLIVNDDGTLAVAALLLEQNVLSFSKCTTSGTFLETGVDNTDMYFGVERTINSETVRFLERFNNNHYSDASTLVTSGLPTDTFSSLDYLEGETVTIYADESVLSNEVVTNGSVTIDREATTSCEIGLNYTPEVKTLPIEMPGAGTSVGKKKRIVGVTLVLYETQSIILNSNVVSFRGFGEAGAGSPLDAAPPQFTGRKRIDGLLGRDDLGQLTITQDKAAPMTVLAIEQKVNF